MKFYGHHKTTLLEYPQHIASILFTGGCNMRCPYCHNPELVITSSGSETIDESEIFNFLEKRKGILEAICITGGEPLLYQNQIVDFISKVKDSGLKVKIDTNGSFPDTLKKLNVDYIAMDIKTSFSKYDKIGYTGDNLIEKLKSSIDFILNDFKGEYEFRTTVVPQIVEFDDIKNITDYIPNAKNYVLSQFRPMKTFDISLNNVTPYSKDELEEMKEYCLSKNIITSIRANYHA